MIFIGAILGVVFSLSILQKNLIFFIVALVLSIGFLIFILVTSFLKTKKFAFLNKFIICFLIGFLFFLGLGIVNFKLFNKNLIERENVNISSRVCSVI